MPHLFRATDLSLVGLLVALAGCANTPVSQSTPVAELPSSFATTDSGDSKTPVPLRTVAPEYPYDMRRSGLSGVVSVHCLIDENGRVQDPRVQKTTDPAFNQVALAAVKQWTFRPARRDGIAVPARVSIPIKFISHEP